MERKEVILGKGGMFPKPVKNLQSRPEILQTNTFKLTPSN
jgi:hypothetical protein